MLLLISTAKKLLGYFMKKSCKRKAKNNSGQEKQSREKTIDLTPNESAMITHLKAGLKKGYSITMSQYFLPHPYERSGRNVKFELDLRFMEPNLI